MRSRRKKMNTRMDFPMSAFLVASMTLVFTVRKSTAFGIGASKRRALMDTGALRRASDGV